MSVLAFGLFFYSLLSSFVCVTISTCSSFLSYFFLLTSTLRFTLYNDGSHKTVEADHKANNHATNVVPVSAAEASASSSHGAPRQSSSSSSSTSGKPKRVTENTLRPDSGGREGQPIDVKANF